MPEFSGYAAGTPCWVDLMPQDPGAAREFYAAMFGWEYDIGPAEMGNYTMARLKGSNVAGMGGQPAAEGTPTVWTTYIAADDADATAARAVKAGGTVLVEPMDVMGAGRMAVIADPTGAVFGLWQPGGHTGAQLANEPGTFSWNELVTRDIDGALPFYTAVFGYEYDEMPMDGAPPYHVLKVNGKPVGGAMAMPAALPAAVPPHWMTYFSVADTDAAVRTAEEKGAVIRMAPMDSPFGRFAVIQDPQGAVFTVIAPSPEQPATA